MFRSRYQLLRHPMLPAEFSFPEKPAHGWYMFSVCIQVASCNLCLVYVCSGRCESTPPKCCITPVPSAERTPRCTGDRIVMSDICDCRTYPITPSPFLSIDMRVFLDVIQNHLSLQFQRLVCIETYIISIPLKFRASLSVLISTAGWLTVEPAQRLSLAP